jgi:cell division transport system permease protein
MFLQLWRVIQAGSRNFMRNAWLSTAATAVMTLTLMIVVISFVSSWALSSTIKGVTNKLDVSVYLANTTTDTQRQDFQKAIEADSNVDGVTFITQKQAVELYKQQNRNNPALIAGIDQVADSIPASFQIRAKDPNKLDSIASVVSRPEFKALLDPTAPPSYSGTRKNTIDKIVSFSNFFKTAGLIASGIFIVISILIIFNTIRMAIFTRRDEIEIMKLVGATKWFIRGPFLWEAAMYGILAAFIAVSLSYILLLGGGPKLSGYIDVQATMTFFRSYPILILGGEIMIGILIGMFSSLLAMSRYLKL